MKETKSGPGLWSRKESARWLGVCTRTIDNLMAKGAIRKTQVGRRVLLRPDDLERFVNSRTTK